MWKHRQLDEESQVLTLEGVGVLPLPSVDRSATDGSLASLENAWDEEDDDVADDEDDDEDEFFPDDEDEADDFDDEEDEDEDEGDEETDDL